ncbi:MAG: hypothetical protein WCV84_04105 [Patescibacteria group bacterium]
MARDQDEGRVYQAQPLRDEEVGQGVARKIYREIAATEPKRTVCVLTNNIDGGGRKYACRNWKFQ